MKKRMITVMLATCVLCFAACGKEKNIVTPPVEPTLTPSQIPTLSPSVSPTELPSQIPTLSPLKKPTEVPLPTATPEPEDLSWYDPMLEASILSTGNNARLKRAIEKCKNGEDVYIAMIGGSVTEGAGASRNKGYAYQFIDAFKKAYAPGDGSNVRFVDAGLGGTPSSLGVIRYQRDVVDALGAEPDILFIEFAVNDYQEVTNGRAYEALVRSALLNEKDAAVVLTFAVFKNKWNQQELYTPLGELYELPMVSIRNAIVQPFKDKKLTDGKFFSDEYHPTTYGHTVMSDCLMHLFELIDAEETEEYSEVPMGGHYALDFCGLEMLSEQTEEVLVEKGSFTGVDGSVQTYVPTGKSAFPQNWKHNKADGSEPLKLTLTCKNVLLNFKTTSSADFGTAEVYVDGNKVLTMQGKTSGGWNNSNVVKVLDEQEAAEHVIEIRMAEGQEDKAFTVLAIGFTR